MTKRKLMLVALSLCMVAILAMGGTLAYLTDDEQVTNTFTLGDIDINIEEYTYDDKGWHEWTESELMPIDNVQGYAIKNKVVQTFNTSESKNDAYIRTIVLIEKNKILDATYANEGSCCFPGVHYGYFNQGPAASGDYTYYGAAEQQLSGTVTVDGIEYHAVVFTEKDGKAIPYNGALYTLASIWLDKNIDSDQIKGWHGTDDKKVDVKVISQGIQADSLTHEQAMAELGVLEKAEDVLNILNGVEEGDKNDIADKTVN